MSGDAGVQPRGLAECRQMDQQLASIASARFRDIADRQVLLDEVLRCVDYLKLLVRRRVSKEWLTVILRPSAPFLKEIAICLDDIPKEQWVDSLDRFIFKHALWKFTKSATTLLLFREKTPVARSSLCSPEQIQTIWMAYQRKVATSGRSVLINKVIYAKTEVSARVFLYPIVCRTGFQTVLYQCELALPMGKLITLGTTPEEVFVLGLVEIPAWVRIRDKLSYVLSAADEKSMRDAQVVAYQRHPRAPFVNPAAVHFAKQGAWLDDISMAELKTMAESEDKSYIAKFMEDLTDLHKRFDPGNQAALQHFLKGELMEFAATSHPLVTTLLLLIMKFKARPIHPE